MRFAAKALGLLAGGAIVLNIGLGCSLAGSQVTLAGQELATALLEQGQAAVESWPFVGQDGLSLVEFVTDVAEAAASNVIDACIPDDPQFPN